MKGSLGARRRWQRFMGKGMRRSNLTDAQREAIAQKILAAFPQQFTSPGKVRQGKDGEWSYQDRPFLAAIALYVAEFGADGVGAKRVSNNFGHRAGSLHNVGSSHQTTNKHWEQTWRYIDRLREVGVLLPADGSKLAKINPDAMR